MSLAISGDTIAYLMSLGLSGDQMKGLIDHLQRDAMAMAPPTNGINEERERLRNESTYAERKRAKDRDRQRLLREEQRHLREQSRDVAGESRDVAVDRPTSTATEGDEPATDGDAALTYARVVNTTSSSLRSEEAYPPEKPSASTPKGAKASRRASKRAPESWSPSERTIEALIAEGHSPGSLERALTRMRDHEYRTPRSDWDAAFRNWVRPDPRHAKPDPDDKFTRNQANLARAFAGFDAAARRGRLEP